jgi:hypothetical protein
MRPQCHGRLRSGKASGEKAHGAKARARTAHEPNAKIPRSSDLMASVSVLPFAQVGSTATLRCGLHHSP